MSICSFSKEAKGRLDRAARTPAPWEASWGSEGWVGVPSIKGLEQDFPGGQMVKNPPANAGDMGLIPGPGIFHMPRGN